MSKQTVTEAIAEDKPLTTPVSEAFDTAKFFQQLKDSNKPKEVGSETEKPEVKAEEIEDEVEEPETTEASEESEETEEEIPSAIDWENMTDEQRAEVATQVQPELQAKLTELEQARTKAEADLEELKGRFESELGNVLDPNNPYAKIKDAKELQRAVQSDQVVLKKLHGLLRKDPETDDDGNEGYRIGKDFYTRAEVEQEADLLMDSIVRSPDQFRRIESLSRVSEVREQAQKEVEAYPWFKSAKSPQRKEYEAVMQNKSLRLLQDAAPEIAAQLPAFVAAWADRKHAAASRAPIRLPLRQRASTAISASGGRGTSVSEADEKQTAIRRLRDGNHSNRDVIKAFGFV